MSLFKLYMFTDADMWGVDNLVLSCRSLLMFNGLSFVRAVYVYVMLMLMIDETGMFVMSMLLMLTVGFFGCSRLLFS